MSTTLSSIVDWSPEALPFAPRPLNGELLSSWALRLAAANGISVPEICACVGNLLGNDFAKIFDYGAPKPWRFAMAALTRIPERWVWVLDLEQQFPAIGREWFAHRPARPERMRSGFCPECLGEQIATRQPLHLKAEWAIALITRCLKHQLPLYRFCPWCGHGEAVHFEGNVTVRCLYCGQELFIRPRLRNPAIPEPLIAAFERAVVEALAGKAPDPAWGKFTARSFRNLLMDLVWMLTSSELCDPAHGCALVDHIVSNGFLTKSPYGHDFETPFYARSSVEREAVVCAIIQVLLGSQADGGLRVCGPFRKTAEFRPFLEILRGVRRNESRLWARIGGWPGGIQDRAHRALRFLESETKRGKRKLGSGSAH